MFDEVRKSITRNILEIKLWINSIVSDKSNSNFQAISYGLFFVYIYGIYESIIKQIISITIDELNHTGISINSCSYELYPVLLSNEYDSLFQVSDTKKWEKRWNISQKFITNSIVAIPKDLFPTDGKNIRIKQLESLKNSFGVNKDTLPRPEIGGYIQEMVDHRNHIAHGDVLPKEVGRAYTKNDLLIRCSIIAEICNYLCDIYEEFITKHEYLKPS